MLRPVVRTDHGRPLAPARGALRPLGLDEVTITGGFWARKQQLNAAKIIAHCEKWIERVGWISNFDAASDERLPQDRTGMVFTDSDVYKLVEAMCWEVGRSGDAAMEKRLSTLIARIAAAQEPDGYLNTAFGRPGQLARYSDFEWGHELYGYGHLIQAAIARGRTRGDDLLVTVATRAADHICATFGEGGLHRVGGHPEIEMALVEFSRFTGEQRYRDQARLFIERRGHGVLGPIPFGPAYFQDDVPLRRSRVMDGHAVRALYLTAGGIDLAVDSDDDELLRALIEQTVTTVVRRTYITGGMGAHHEGESFGQDWELPPDRAYSETCAGVASVMVNQRLLLATGDPRYADIVERTLYNVVATSPASDGESFFYTNTLHQRERGTINAADEVSPRAANNLRATWFEVSCCPSNVARMLASLESYIATRTNDGVQLHQYADATIHTVLDDGSVVGLTVSTAYPDGGRIQVEVTTDAKREWTMSLRIPVWASGASITYDGRITSVAPGAAAVTANFRSGDIVELNLPVAPRFTWPHPRVDAVRGTVAVERGPLVMCLESTDLPLGTDVADVRVLTRTQPSDVDGATMIDVEFVTVPESTWAFLDKEERDAPSVNDRDHVRLIPYHDWANRGPSTMRVWIPITDNRTVY